MVQPLWKTFCQLCRRLTMELPYDLAIPLSIHQRELKHMHKHLYVFYFYIHENIIHYIPKLKRTQKSINWWMDKENVIDWLYPYNEILFTNRKQWSTDTGYNMDEAWRYKCESKTLSERSQSQNVISCSTSLITAAAAKLLQSCPTLCDPIEGSSPGSPVPGILQARTLEWVVISFSNAWKWKVKSEIEVAQSCLTLCDPMDCSLPGSSIHGIFQARVLEWGAIALSTLVIRVGQIKVISHPSAHLCEMSRRDKYIQETD